MEKGKEHCIADAFSRAPINDPAMEEDDLDLSVQLAICCHINVVDIDAGFGLHQDSCRQGYQLL